MVNGIDPLSLRVVLSSAFPVLWMHQMDLAIFVGFSCSLALLDILEPLNMGHPGMVKSAKVSNDSVKIGWFIFPKKGCKLAIYQTSFFHWW
jgi:hypothetical protein